MNKQNKQRLGNLIRQFRRYYQSVSPDFKWVQKNFIMLNGEEICSVKSLVDIENNRIGKEEVYEGLLKQLDLTFTENTILDSLLGDIVDEFYSSILRYNRTAADRIISKLTNYPESGCAYYKQIIESMKFVVAFEFDNQCTENLDYYLMLTRCMEYNKLAYLVSYSVFILNLETAVSASILTESSKIAMNSHQNDELYLEFKMIAHQINREFLLERDQLFTLISLYKEKSNFIRQLKMELHLSTLETILDSKNGSHLQLIKLQELLKKCVLPDRLFISSYSQLTILYYMDKNYEETIRSAELVAEKSPTFIYKLAPYYFSAKEKIKSRIYRLKVNKPDNLNCEDNYYTYYHYYFLKHIKRASSKELLNYLVDQVCPAIHRGVFGIETMNIFEDEAFVLAQKSRMYKKYLEFKTNISHR